jgi:hypothetical protein
LLSGLRGSASAINSIENKLTVLMRLRFPPSESGRSAPRPMIVCVQSIRASRSTPYRDRSFGRPAERSISAIRRPRGTLRANFYWTDPARPVSIDIQSD